MNSQFDIPLSYNPVDHNAIAATLSRYQQEDHTTMVLDFEAALSKVTTSPFVTALNSGSAAIHLALKALEVGEDDYVIVSTFTYVASVSPIVYLRAIPVLVDCDAQTWNMDTALLEDAIRFCIGKGKKPKAIIVVHTYGLPARMDEIMQIARHYEIAVLEDAAEAIGATYHGRPLGTVGDIGVLSFNNNKILTTYGGGAVLSKRPDWAASILSWATHARRHLPYYEHDEIGFNYRMGPLNAAAGLVQIADLQTNVEARRTIFETYRKLIDAKCEAAWQQETPDSLSNRWITCVLLPRGLENIRKRLTEARIETRPLWNPMHLQPVFRHCHSFLNGTSEKLFSTGVCLPSGNNLTLQTVEMIAAYF